jgi:hypothetical protein
MLITSLGNHREYWAKFPESVEALDLKAVMFDEEFDKVRVVLQDTKLSGCA